MKKDSKHHIKRVTMLASVNDVDGASRNQTSKSPCSTTLIPKRELRLAIVKNCNFRCFFCHSEGLDRHGKEPKIPCDEHVSLLDSAIIAGFDDITFTGGEPTLRAQQLAEIIRKLAKQDAPPAITIVSNASRISQELVDVLASYPGKCKTNISLHAIEESGFDKVTVTHGYWLRVQENIKKLIHAGITVKLNTVMLKGVNTGRETILAHIRYAHGIGASALKLIEFLVTPENREHYHYFYSLDAVLSDLAQNNVHVIREGPRTVWLASSDFPGLSIEAVRCVCKMGCSHCHDLRDIQIAPDHLYHPCFIHPDKGISVGKGVDGLSHALIEGKEQIDRYAAFYGDDSPLLIHRDEFVSSRREVFWQASDTLSNMDEETEQRWGLQLKKIRKFRLVYCLPIHPDEKWMSCQSVLKFGYDEHTPNRFEIVFSDQIYEPSAHGLVTEVIYRTPQTQVIPASSEDEALAYMKAHGYRKWFSHDFNIHEYWHPMLEIMLGFDMNDIPPSVRLLPESVGRPEVKEFLLSMGMTSLCVPLTSELARKATDQEQA